MKVNPLKSLLLGLIVGACGDGGMESKPLAAPIGAVPFIDVDSDPALQQDYGMLVPVIVVDGRRISELRLELPALTELRRCLEGVR